MQAPKCTETRRFCCVSGTFPSRSAPTTPAPQCAWERRATRLHGTGTKQTHPGGSHGTTRPHRQGASENGVAAALTTPGERQAFSGPLPGCPLVAVALCRSRNRAGLCLIFFPTGIGTASVGWLCSFARRVLPRYRLNVALAVAA